MAYNLPLKTSFLHPMDLHYREQGWKILVELTEFTSFVAMVMNSVEHCGLAHRRKWLRHSFLHIEICVNAIPDF